MITCNCDGHPLLGRLHKPDPTLPADQQDKRAVAHIDPADWSTWLHGPVAEAQARLDVQAQVVNRRMPLVPERDVVDAKGCGHRSTRPHGQPERRPHDAAGQRQAARRAVELVPAHQGPRGGSCPAMTFIASCLGAPVIEPGGKVASSRSAGPIQG